MSSVLVAKPEWHPNVLKLIPEDDRWALTPGSRVVTLHREAERRKALADRLVHPDAGAMREAFLVQCANDPGFFVKNCVWTKDPERNMGCGTELPLIPYTYMLKEVPLRAGIKAGGWIEKMHSMVKGTGAKRLCISKSRRMLFSIIAASFYVWAMRFEPGFAGWVSSVRENRIDAGNNFDAIMGKIRYIWRKCHEFYPWMYPALPEWGTSSVNKEFYIEFPEWVEGGREIARDCWGNCCVGAMPSESSRRGGASYFGVCDEAGFMEELAKFIDDMEVSTSNLILGSSVGRDPQHPFSERMAGRFGYDTSVAPCLLNPMMMEDYWWEPDGEDLVPWVRKHRSKYIAEKLETLPRDVFERNVNINPRGVAGSRVLVSFTPDRCCGSPTEGKEGFDLYDPHWHTEIWYDAGGGDAWASWWVQVSDATGEVRLVDFWMRENVTIEWWMPLWLGWNPDKRNYWRTMPDREPWKKRVWMPYGDEDLEICALWAERYAEAGARRPRIMYTDTLVRQRNAASPHTAEQLAMHYGIVTVPVQSSHRVEDFADHANTVLQRTRIEGRIAERHPFSGGITWPSPVEVFMHWEWLPGTPRNPRRQPAHDVYSHPATAYVHGCQHLPAKIPGSLTISDTPDAGRRLRAIPDPDKIKRRMPYTATVPGGVPPLYSGPPSGRP